MELQEEQQQQLEAAIEIRQEYRELLKSPAWVRLVDIFRSQAEQRVNEILNPSEDLNGIFRKERLGAERNMLLMFAQFPQLLIEGLDEEIDELTMDLDEDDADAS